MNRQDAEKIITENLRAIFGFSLKRCKTIHDAEDLTQEIVLRSFKALLAKDDIGDVSKFVWTIAHNILSNYYRDNARAAIGVSIDEISELVADAEQDMLLSDNADTIKRLQSEIAYLSKTQRRVVIAYYFENRKQADIAAELNIPLGTVKWHLFEAKKELKRGIDTMRKTSELKFNPIEFSAYGINGEVGKRSCEEFFRSSLVQNICYCIRNTAKTVNEIADDLGVSPVYVEGEVEFLERYGFLKKEKDRYIINFIMNEPTAELLTMQDKMYKKAAELFANDLYDELMSSGLLNSNEIICTQSDEPLTLTKSERADMNFILWALIPFISATSGEALIADKIKFDEVATIRPDGAHNIFNATVTPKNLTLPSDYVYMRGWCGPHSVNIDRYAYFNVDTEWSGRRIEVSRASTQNVMRMLSLYENELEDGLLSKDDYVWLSEHGYIKTTGEYDGSFKSSWQVVTLETKEILSKLIAIGDKIKKKHQAEFEELKKPYVRAVLESLPEHVRKMREYELQFTFSMDGWFLLHCIVTLLNNGKLKPPTQNQKKTLSAIIFPK